MPSLPRPTDDQWWLWLKWSISMNGSVFPKTPSARATGREILWTRSRLSVCLAVLPVIHGTPDPLNLLDAANDVDCAVRMYRKICGIAAKAGKALVLSKYTTDLKKDYESGRLGMIITTATISPKDGDRSHFVAVEPTPQELKAYTLWHTQGLSLAEMCVALRSKDNPLKETTVM